MKAPFAEALGGLRYRRIPTAVAVTGLALSLAACLLVAMLAVALSQPDPAIPDPERTVLLQMKLDRPGESGEWMKQAPLAMAALLKQRGTSLQNVSRVVSDGLDIRHEERLQPALPFFVDPAVPEMLGLATLSGDVGATLRRPDGIVMTKDLARRLWGEVSPAQVIGRRIEARGSARPKEFLTYTVGAVVADVDPRNPVGFRSPFIGAASAFLGFGSQAAMPGFADPTIDDVGMILARIPAGVTDAEIAARTNQAFEGSAMYAQLPPELKTGRSPAEFRVLSLDREPREDDSRWPVVVALAAASALLLLLAVLNAMNLQTATLAQRRRETALRLSVGADARQLLQLWTTEVSVIFLAAAMGALLIAWWLAPAVAQWMALPPEYGVGNPIAPVVLWGLALVVLMLIPLTLAVPAWRALRRAPAPALQGRTPSDGPWGRRVRQGLLSFQLAGALGLLAMAGIIAVQQRHVLTTERGFETRDRLIIAMLVNPEEVPSMDPLLAALDRHPQVEGWTFGFPGVSESTTEKHTSGTGRNATLRVNTVSPGFFKTFGILLLAGTPRVGAGETNVVIDANAARLLGYTSPQAAVGELLRAGEGKGQGGGEGEGGVTSRRIVAVVNTLKLESARESAMPNAFILSDRERWDLSVHVAAAATARASIDALFASHGPRVPYLIQTVDEAFADRYTQERQLTQLLSVCALLAICVAMLGAYALVSDTLRRRRTEIILHRLHGANDFAILREVARELAIPLLVALAIAAPLVVVLGRVHLAGFVERVDAGRGLVLPLIAAALVVTGVTLLSALRHFRAALALQPIEALR